MSVAIVAGALGIAQGVRHALEPDHLAAVSTLASERPGARGGFWLGASWGVGHTAALVVVGGTLAALETRLSVRWAAAFELGVAIMLVSLGIRAIRRSAREGRRGHHHTHTHGRFIHTHAAPQRHLHAGQWTLSTRPLVIGLVHGLAGSGALSALVMAELPDAASRLLYITLFGLGSVLGMAGLTAVVGTPLARLGHRSVWAARVLFGVGALSVALGLWWGATSAQAVISG